MHKFTFTVRETNEYGESWGDMTITVIAENRQDAIEKAVDISGYKRLRVFNSMVVEPYNGVE